MTQPPGVQERGRALYNTRQRVITAVRRHLIGMGVPGVGEKGSGYAREVTIDGYNVVTVKNLRRDMDKHGRTVVMDRLMERSPLPLVIIEVPRFAEDPEEAMVTMPINTFISLLTRKD